MRKSYYKHPADTGSDVHWINTKGWFKVGTPARFLGDEVVTTYGRHIATVSFIVFEDERDAIMCKLRLK